MADPRPSSDAFDAAAPLPAGPRVLVDGYFLDRVSGFGRYMREMVHALDGHRALGVDIVLLVPSPLAAWAQSIAPHLRVVHRARRTFALWEQWVVPGVARSLGCDLVHFPYQSTALAWPRAATVCTIHDMMFLRPSGSSGTLVDRLLHAYRRILFGLQTQHARRLIAVSDATNGELRAHTRGVSRVILNSGRAVRLGPSRRRRGRARALLPAPRRRPAQEHRPGRAGHGAGAHRSPRCATARLRSVPAAAQALHRDDPAVQYVGKVSDEALAALFKGAVAVVSPSTEEGFGLATIEAFGFGTPAVTSHQPPMSDVAGGAALLVDPTSTAQIAGALQRLLSDPACSRQLRAAGHARYASFASAQAYAQQLCGLYREAAGPGR